MAILVSNVILPEDEAGWPAAVASRLGVPARVVLAAKLVRRSLDARGHRQRWRGTFHVEVDDEARVLAKTRNARPFTDRDAVRYGLVDGGPEKRTPPPGAHAVVVGAGPAGLFAALWLAEAGWPVTLLERGGATPDRVAAVNGFWRHLASLDPDNNLVFGEGGAGTFSDGKIYTRRRDGEVGYVLRRFVRFGARPDILEEGWAHLGTDKVRALLPVFRAHLGELGVTVRFGARVDDLVLEGGRVVGVRLGSGEEVRGSHVLVGPGHSARDTLAMLVAHGAEAVRRPVAIGARVEHPQTAIDLARYGTDDRGELPAASYRLAWEGEGIKARTFCMCPGGMVVPAINHAERVVVNGMSFAAQRAFWANSAIIVEVEPEVYGPGDDPLAGFAWQDAIEARAYAAAGETYAAPAQRVDDFLAGRPSEDLPRSSYPLGVVPADLRAVLPPAVVEGMIGALRAFDAELPGFIQHEAVLIAPETRTTSPMRFLRDEACQSTTLPGLFPMGEGAGYGGGIVSCALDGLRVARGVLGGETGGAAGGAAGEEADGGAQDDHG